MKKKWTGHHMDAQKIRYPPIWFETFLLCKHLTASIKELAPKCRGKLLDVGSGTAPYKPFFTKFVEEYITVDSYKIKGQESDYIASVYDLPFKSNSFDCVLCTQVFEHLEQPHKAIDEMYRVLKPGGKLILSTHMAMVLHCEPYDYFRFTKYGLRLLCKKFKRTKIITNGGVICFMSQIISWAFFYKFGNYFSRPFITFFNIVGRIFDKLLYSDYITLNYFVYAIK